MTKSSVADGDGLQAAYRKVRDLIVLRASFLLTTHRRPDGDGLGSESALAEALRQMNKRVLVVNSDPVPARYRFLPGVKSFETYAPQSHRAQFADAEVVVLLDAAFPERTGRPAEALSDYQGVSVAIDHHQRGGWAQVDLIDPGACATTEMVHDLIGLLPVKVTPTMAEALYAGLVTDTQSFTTAHTTARAHRRAAQLLEAGADAVRVNQALAASWDLRRLHLLGGFLSGLRTSADGQLVWGVVTQEDLKRLGRSAAELEGFVDQALTIAGSKVAVLFHQEPEGDYTLSFRSRPGVKVDHLARSFGGGGHPLAAGARVSASGATAMFELLKGYDTQIEEHVS